MSLHSESIEISAAPDAVFFAVSHLESMGRFSPENTGGTWVRGASGPELDAKFKGSNASGSKTWSTMATVVECDRPRQFAFEVTFGPVKVARWEYIIEETPTGSRVTESWIDRRSKLVAKLAKTPVTDRAAFTQESIRTTLENLKTFLEAPAPIN